MNKDDPIAIGQRKIKMDPTLQIKVNVNDITKATPAKLSPTVSIDEDDSALATGHKKRPNTGSGNNQ